MRIGALEVDDQRGLAGVRRRVDPGVDAARCDGGDGLVAAPVESGGEAAVHLRSRNDRGGEGEQRHAEAERIRVTVDHARRGRGDANGLDFALEARLMGRPKRLRVGIAMVIGERVGERRGRTVACLRVPVEPGKDVGPRRTTQAQERRKGDPAGEREHNDAADAEGARRELPDARPRGGEKQDQDGERKDERRPDPLDQKRPSRQDREDCEPTAAV